MTTDKSQLPPLQSHDHPDFVDGRIWTESEIEAIQDYALAALEQVQVAQAIAVEAAWIGVNDCLPECDMTPNSFGVPVLVYPPYKSDGVSEMTQAFYGCRQTDTPNFYIFGTVFYPEYWQPIPAAPSQGAKHNG